jgi:hypothetical protein
MTVEYKKTYINPNQPESAIETLTALGKDSWEIGSAIGRTSDGMLILVMQRRVFEKAPKLAPPKTKPKRIHVEKEGKKTLINFEEKNATVLDFSSSEIAAREGVEGKETTFGGPKQNLARILSRVKEG